VWIVLERMSSLNKVVVASFSSVTMDDGFDDFIVESLLARASGIKGFAQARHSCENREIWLHVPPLLFDTSSHRGSHPTPCIKTNNHSKSQLEHRRCCWLDTSIAGYYMNSTHSWNMHRRQSSSRLITPAVDGGNFVGDNNSSCSSCSDGSPRRSRISSTSSVSVDEEASTRYRLVEVEAPATLLEGYVFVATLRNNNTSFPVRVASAELNLY
jgi:hypothetical protein